ncbi:MAG: alpha/beta hydrolase [Alphaproteobacteria bacterium]|nr:MAG: alpha/beta hydrolase [Alphaproteobacteria bacterium]
MRMGLYSSVNARFALVRGSSISCLQLACLPFSRKTLLVLHIRTQQAVSYGSDARHKLDLYVPRGGGSARLPLIVFYYGGSWKSGDRKLYPLWGRGLASLGAVVAIPDYRLFPQVKFPGFIHDGADALGYLLQEADALNLDPSRVALIGHSAGAHLAASLALDPDYLCQAPQHRITHLCPISGPLSTDLLQFDSVKDIFEGSEPEARRPIKLIPKAASLPKTLLLHGGKDTTVGPHNSVHFANALKDAKADVRLEIFDQFAHVDILVRSWPILRLGAPVWPMIRSFLQDL